jgi:hypothetical protein
LRFVAGGDSLVPDVSASVSNAGEEKLPATSLVLALPKAIEYLVEGTPTAAPRVR